MSDPAPQGDATGAARARLFRLFAQLVGEGFDPSLRSALSGLPGLAELVGPGASADDDAADHQDLFGFRVPPFAGVFLDDSLRIGGAAADHALAAYSAAGLQTVRSDMGADHLAIELSFVARCAQRGDQGAACRFLDEHLLGWLPALVAAVAREPYPEYANLLPLLLDAVVEFREDLGGEVTPLSEAIAPADPLDDPDSGIREIVEYLSIPARSGLFLGRGDVMRLGRDTGVPRGFGGRVLMFTNLLKSAARYEELDVVFAGIHTIADQTASVWVQAGETGAGALPAWTTRWVERLDDTRSMVTRMARRVKDGLERGADQAD